MRKKSIVKSLREYAREKNLSPDDMEIVEKPLHNIFRLKVHGRAMNVNGTITLSYTAAQVSRLFDITHYTVDLWVKRGLLDVPAVQVVGKNTTSRIWLYHQIQPLYSWYIGMCKRGITTIFDKHHAEDIKRLNHQKALQLRRWYKRQGISLVGEYEQLGGKYGVFWLDD